MRVLFCSDALIVDGVTSFVFHLSVALKKGGHRVAVIGRWAGKGFQSRLRENGVEVIQCISPTVGNFWFDRKAAEFSPDVLITDSRRSFPLATRLKTITGAKMFTFFLDDLEKTDRKGRDVQSLVRYSDAWFSAEPPLLERLERIPTPFPKFLFKRPLAGLIRPSPVQPRDPFRVFCLGRLSGYKSYGMWYLLNRSLDLKREIPSLEIVYAGGGWRSLKFRLMAEKLNLTSGERFIRVLGTRTDPQPFFDRATLVCAGSTSAAEAVLANRPVVNFTAFWLGLITPEKIDDALDSYFSERKGSIRLRDNPELFTDELSSVYRNWDDEKMTRDVAKVRSLVEPHFSNENAAVELENIFRNI